MGEKKVRQSGPELLRILMACGVVMLHYNDGKALTYVTSPVNEAALYFLESLCICAVDLFILVCGYYSSTSQKRSLLKPFELYFQVVFLSVGIYAARVLAGVAFKGAFQFSLSGFLSLFILSNYFVALYIVLYFLSPYINLVLKKLNSEQWKKMILTLLLIFSVYAIGVDLFYEIFDVETLGMSPITAWGNHQGFHIVNFVVMYIIGAYLRYENPLKNAKKGKLALLILANTCLITIWAYANNLLSSHGLRSAWVYHNPLVILQSVLLFSLFAKLTFQNAIVNSLAKASYTCFLLHGTILPFIKIQWAVNHNVVIMLLHIAVSIPVIYLISWCVYQVYSFCTGWFYQWLGSFKLFKTYEISD